MAKPTASVSGMNSDRTGSFMRNVGMNTDRMQSMARSRAVAVAASLRRTARANESRVLHLGVGVLDRHDRHVDEDADGQRQAAQRHDVDRIARQPQADQGGRSAPAEC